MTKPSTFNAADSSVIACSGVTDWRLTIVIFPSIAPSRSTAKPIFFERKSTTASIGASLKLKLNVAGAGAGTAATGWVVATPAARGRPTAGTRQHGNDRHRSQSFPPHRESRH